MKVKPHPSIKIGVSNEKGALKGREREEKKGAVHFGLYI